MIPLSMCPVLLLLRSRLLGLRLLMPMFSMVMFDLPMFLMPVSSLPVPPLSKPPASILPVSLKAIHTPSLAFIVFKSHLLSMVPRSKIQTRKVLRKIVRAFLILEIVRWRLLWSNLMRASTTVKGT